MTELRTEMKVSINGCAFRCIMQSDADQETGGFSAFEGGIVGIYTHNRRATAKRPTQDSHFTDVFAWKGNIGDSNNDDGKDNEFDPDNYASVISILHKKNTIAAVAKALRLPGISARNVESFVLTAFAGIVGHSQGPNDVGFSCYGERMVYVIKHFRGVVYNYVPALESDDEGSDADSEFVAPHV